MARAWRHGITVAMLVCVIPAGPIFAATASELFADGNRLFRDDLYWAALLRYREALGAGMDTPLLHYNMGVAHYRAKQPVRAREALRKAAGYGPLAAISRYNLGLNAYSTGSYDEALVWFRQARDQQQRSDISALARRAIQEVQNRIDASEAVTMQAASRERERELTNFDFRLRIGAGVDNNVFRSPAEPYFDLGNSTQPLITPEIQSGMFIPVSLSARYQVNSLENEGFFGSYYFGGRFYQDKNLKNADEVLHELGFGSEYRRRNDDGETRVYSAFKIAQHDETYYDPDNGIERDIGGVDISDRMSYLRYGPEFWAKKRFGPLTIGGRAKGQLWNYEDMDVVSEYDYEYWIMGLNGQFQFTSTSLIRLTAEYYTRRFGDRPAYELDGSQPAVNPNIRYDYTVYDIEARQRITNAMWFSVSYARTEREDRHVGYNNYFRDTYGAAFHLRVGRRFDFEARAFYSIYNYENAFAFHEPTAGRKNLENKSGRATATYGLTPQLDLVAEYTLRDIVSNDARLEYNRGQILLAVRWTQ